MKGIFGVLAFLPALVHSLASTDSYRDADAPQSGYLPNHNLNPNIAGSSSFKTLWSFTSPNNDELWLAKPLIYTPTGGSELVITASEMNWMRVFDSKTGTLLRSRQLQTPFLSSDSDCGDIPKYVGITGTPIIDPATDILYVFSKSYKTGFTSGTINGVYKMFAINLSDLTDVSGFPVTIDGKAADNDPAKVFVAGVAHQRPALTEVNGMIVAGFASHCGRWNYTGYLLSVSKTSGVGVVSLFATESAPGAPKPQPTDLADQRGGGAGIWQSGMGLPTIGNNVYFVTGNGQGHANGNIPASGRLPMSTLDESIVKMEVSPEGKLSLKDYFQPYDYVGLDAGDRDVGSGGLCVMDGSVFNGAGVNRIGVAAGKEGRTYVVNVDNLGGFRQGPGGTDGILQTIELGGSVFGGFGSYPAEGGYIYVTTVGGPLRAYKLGRDNAGKPFFSLAGTSDWKSTGRVGVGQMTVTSDNGKVGSGIVWTTDVTNGIVAHKAVPENGVMVRITMPSMPGSNKYQRPVFGDGRVFYQANSNKLYALGSPVAQAITCQSPADFGNLNIGEVTSKLISCKANAAITGFTNCSSSNPSFRCNSASLPATLASGATFNLNATWDLKNPGTTIVPGALTASITLGLNAGVNYASQSSVDVQGTVVNQGPFLYITPSTVEFGKLVLGEQPDGLSTVSVIQNVGTSALTFEGIAYRSGPNGAYTNLTGSTLGSGFTSTSFPAAGSSLATGATLSLDLKFNQATVGNYSTQVTVWSNGGVTTMTLTASVNKPPAVTFEITDSTGAYVPLTGNSVAFGDVHEGTQVEKKLRICNVGGSTMTITISKPPSNAQLFATNPQHDLAEGTQIEPGRCEVGGITVSAGTIQPNRPGLTVQAEWSLTTDGQDPNSGATVGRKDILFTASITVDQLGPLFANGTARYGYVGCFWDTSSAGRNLQNSVNTKEQAANNTIQQCQTLCFGRGNTFAGVQYHTECWCGNTIKTPSTYTAESLNKCTFDCKGDTLQACGGDGGHMSLYADKEKFDIAAFLRNATQTSSSTTTSMSSTVSSSQTTTSTGGVTTTTSSATTTTTSRSSTASSSGTTTSSSSVQPTTTTSASSVSSSTATTSTTSGSGSACTASPQNPNQPCTVKTNWEYLGCYQDAVNDIRTLPAATTASDDMTLEKCATFCSSGAWNGGAFNYFGTEYGRECYCGWIVTSDLVAPEAECSSTCKGGGPGLCGAGKRLSVFKNLIPNEVPKNPVHVERSGDYKWLGCRTTATTGKALVGKFLASDDMTIDKCAAFCADGKWAYMGVEYARECSCGPEPREGSVEAPVAQCSMLCKGSQFQYCGAGGRLDMYQYLPAPTLSTSTTSATTTSSSLTTTTTSAVTTTTTTSASTVSTASSSSSETTTTTTAASTASSSSSSSETTTTTASSVSTTAGSSSSSETTTSASSSSSSSSSSETTTTTSASTSASSSSSSESTTTTTSASTVSTTSSSSSQSSSSSSTASSSSETTTTSSSSPSTTTTTTTTSPSTTTTTTTTTSNVPATTTTSTTTTTSLTPSSTASSSGPVATNGYYHIGCYQDTNGGRALPRLAANNSMTPELCIAHALSRASAPQPTPAPQYLYLEYYQECYGGNSFDFKGSAVTTLVGTKACTAYCSGSISTITRSGTTTVTTATANRCGGALMFNLYANDTTVNFPTTGGPLVTKTA